MGKIVDFKLNEDNLKNMSLYKINKDDSIIKNILNSIDISKFNTYNDEDNNMFNKFQEEFERIIPDNKFKNRMISLLNLIKNYTDQDYLVVDGNVIGGYIDSKYYILLSITNDGVKYELENEDYISNGKLKFIKDKYVVRYYETNKSSLYDMVNKSNKITYSCDVDTKIYDNNGFNIFKRDAIGTYSLYSKNNDELLEIDKYNNITIDKYTRVGNNVLKSRKVHYFNKDNYKDNKFIIDKDTVDVEDYYIGYDYKNNLKDISDDIYYNDIEYDDYLDIKSKRK